MSDEDIYDDLETSIFTQGGDKRKEEENKERQLQLQTALREVERLKGENKRLVKENKTYATNISSLFLTARNEIDKKNFLIKQLQSKLEDLTKIKIKGSSSSLSKAEVEEVFKKCQEAKLESSRGSTLEELKKAVSEMQADADKKKKNGHKKQYNFGNMSLFFYREQIPTEETSTSEPTGKKRRKC